MAWNIEPFVGMGPLRFDMSTTEAAGLLDQHHPVMHRDPQEDGSVSEFRSRNVPVCNFIDGKLQTIDTNWNVIGVLFSEIDVYRTPSKQVLQLLERASGGASIGLGMVYFKNLGIATTGFFDKKTSSFYDINSREQDDRGLSASRRGAFDAFLQHFKDISFL